MTKTCCTRAALACTSLPSLRLPLMLLLVSFQACTNDCAAPVRLNAPLYTPVNNIYIKWVHSLLQASTGNSNSWFYEILHSLFVSLTGIKDTIPLFHSCCRWLIVFFFVLGNAQASCVDCVANLQASWADGTGSSHRHHVSSPRTPRGVTAEWRTSIMFLPRLRVHNILCNFILLPGFLCSAFNNTASQVHLFYCVYKFR